MRFNKLTDLIEKLKKDKYGVWSKQTNGADGSDKHPFEFPYVNYSKTVRKFIDIMYEIEDENSYINFSDYKSEMKKRKIDSLIKIEKKGYDNLSCEDILLILFFIIRYDRFCEGIILARFNDGFILKLLEVLKEKDKIENNKVRYFKKNKGDKIWWIEDGKLEFKFTFNKKKVYYLYKDYPYNMSEEEIKIFSKENPRWRQKFDSRFLEIEKKTKKSIKKKRKTSNKQN